MSRFLIGAAWDDAPHLDSAVKETLWASIPEYQRDARAKGIPQLGSGAIYPFPESSIRVDDFSIPKHYARAFGLDCALAGTAAAAWGALDRDTDILYITSVYKRAQTEVAVHAAAIKARGQWVPGAGHDFTVREQRQRFLAERCYFQAVAVPSLSRRELLEFEAGLIRRLQPKYSGRVKS